MAEDGRDNKGLFAEGNRIWMLRSSAGPKPKFYNPDKLWKCACEYFEWSHTNPLIEDKIGFFEGSGVHEDAEKMRPFTIWGLCNFLDIIPDTWYDWRKTRPDLSDIIRKIETVIRQQKFDGAAAGLLNANIIARDLGLADKSELQNLDKNGQPADAAQPEAYMAAALALIEKAKKNG